MASISSSTSTNSTSSLGNTSLRGFGGMVSGIDRDSIIEQMTLRTKTKVANKQKEITKLGWKQEAYQSLSDKIIDWSDKYASYTSSSCLKDANMFAKKIITVKGLDESTRFVTATGTSGFLDNVSITGVKQLATASVLQSKSYSGKLSTNLDIEKLQDVMPESRLAETQLVFEDPTNTKDTISFPFASSYKNAKGEIINIDFTWKENEEYTYTIDGVEKKEQTGAQRLVDQLNEFRKLGLDDKDVGKLADKFEFVLDNGKINIKKLTPDGDTSDWNTYGGYVISGSSSALTALGFTTGRELRPDESKNLTADKTFAESAMTDRKTYDYLAGKKLTFNYNGSQKEVELLTKAEAEELKKAYNEDSIDSDTFNNIVVKNLQSRLNQAYGTGNVIAEVDEGVLSFKTSDESSSVSVTSGDNVLLKNLGLAFGESSKVNLNGKLNQSALSIDAKEKGYLTDSGELDLKINGVAIKGLTADSSISDILSKINSTEAAGVKATYVDATGQFMLVSSETGQGREINLGKGLAEDLFGFDEKSGSGGYTSGKNAIIEVSYGNGVTVDLNRASNTFNLEGLNVTVSGVFGGKWETEKLEEPIDGEALKKLQEEGLVESYKKLEDGKYEVEKRKEWKSDSAGAVTFSAKADVDGVTEKVKEFFEEYNALVKEINDHVVTRPDSSYEPLTDEQKAEMDDKSIENWENKAKQGILYGDSTVQSLSNAMQGVFTRLMSNGASYDDLKKIGITYSEDWGDGGVLVFDEDTFRSAMESDPELVSNIFTGGGGVSKGLIDTIDDTFTPYATRYASKNASNGSSGHYGMLVEIAGSSKKSSTLTNSQIYRELKTMNEELERLKELLSKEESRYISQFTTMESLINQYNSQSSYLSQITG